MRWLVYAVTTTTCAVHDGAVTWPETRDGILTSILAPGIVWLMKGGLRPRMYWNSLSPLLVHCTLYSWLSDTVWLHLSTTVSPSLAYLGTMADSSNRSLQSEKGRRHHRKRCVLLFRIYTVTDVPCIIILYPYTVRRKHESLLQYTLPPTRAHLHVDIYYMVTRVCVYVCEFTCVVSVRSVRASLFFDGSYEI